MSEEFDSATTNLSEQTKKLEIASFYTYGDLEKAKQMVAGNFKDVYAIKGKFTASSMNGAFLIFFNTNTNRVNSIYLVLSHSFTVADIKTNTGWKNFEKDLIEIAAKSDRDNVLEQQLHDFMSAQFSLKFSTDLKKLFDNSDEISVNRLFHNFVRDRMGFMSVNMSVDYEQITSIDMELFSTSSMKIAQQSQFKPKPEENKAGVTIGEDNPLQGKDVKLLLRGNVVLSPVKGKDIGTVEVGDRIKVNITEVSPKAIQVARAFDAYRDGNFRPIPGRVVYIRHISPAGYVIYTIVAKAIYVRIDEEEEHIKIALDQPLLDAPVEENSKSMRIFMMVLAVAVAVIVIAALLIKYT